MKSRAMTLMMALTLAAGACSSSDSENDSGTTKEAGVDSSDGSDNGSDNGSAIDSATDKSPDKAVPDKAVPDRAVPDAPLGDWRVIKTWVGEPCTENGASCTDESDEDFCVIGGYWVWQGGYCTKSCVLEDPSTCPEGSYCSMFNEDGPNPNYCIKNCKTKADCRADEGYVCDYWGGCIWFQ